jgi:hypothetical protein
MVHMIQHIFPGGNSLFSSPRRLRLALSSMRTKRRSRGYPAREALPYRRARLIPLQALPRTHRRVHARSAFSVPAPVKSETKWDNIPPVFRTPEMYAWHFFL